MINKPIRILMFGMHDKIGGVETFLINYLRNIDREKIIFDFVSPFSKICFESEIEELGGKVYKVPSEKKHPIKYYKQIKKIINENKYNFVHINMLSAANILPVIISKRLKVKHIIIHSHNSNTPKGIIRKIMHFFNKPLLNMGTDFFACSKLAANWMFGRKINKNGVTIIKNAIDIQKFEYNKETEKSVRKELDIEDNFIIGNVGRFSYQKNHEFLLDVFNEIHKEVPNAKLLLIGEGELEQEIRKKVDKLNIKEKVIFLGSTNDVERYFQAMDVFIFPSRFEGLGIVAIEAQAAGLNCYVSEEIPFEVQVTNLIKFISLKESAKRWSEIILKDKVTNRRSYTSEISNYGYDIKTEAQKLQEKYIDLEKESHEV